MSAPSLTVDLSFHELAMVVEALWDRAEQMDGRANDLVSMNADYVGAAVEIKDLRDTADYIEVLAKRLAARLAGVEVKS